MRFAFTIIVLFTFLMCNSAHAAKIGGIKGKVIDTVDGKPVAGATVIATTNTDIESEMKYAKVTTKTGKDGSFVINGIRNKGYRINVSKAGFFRSGEAFETVPNESNKIISNPIRISSGISGLDIKNKNYIIDKDSNIMWSRSVIFDNASNQQTDEYLSWLNASKYAGYDDWRLPRGNEANSLCRKFYSHLNDYAPGTYQGNIWTANVMAMLTNTNDRPNWYNVRTLNGFYKMKEDFACVGEKSGDGGQYNKRALWPVRGGVPFPVSLKNKQNKITKFETIQAAINSSNDGDTILLENKIYDEQIKIIDKNDLTIVGINSSIEIKRDDTVIEIINSNNIKLQSLGVKHNIGQPCSDNCINIINSKKVSISGCDIHGSGFVGIYISGNSEETKIENNKIHNCTYGVSAYVPKGLKIQFINNKLYENKTDFAINEVNSEDPAPAAPAER